MVAMRKLKMSTGECFSIVTFLGNMTHILLEFIPSESRRRRRMDLNEEAGKKNESHQRYSDLLSVRWFSRPSWAGRPAEQEGRTHTSERASEMRQ